MVRSAHTRARIFCWLQNQLFLSRRKAREREI
jgi:hypothetical protein